MSSLSFNEMAQTGPPARCLVQTHHLLRQPHNLSVINLRASRVPANRKQNSLWVIAAPSAGIFGISSNYFY